ncbi:MAG: hypothetical protein UT02_C0020G0009 [Parcubacteria group bacterium GW2011_GWC2_38_7]|nr:MAG: hypothetical protein UT02_C0020G0009 [Parcubacteria group bacterium GW2011_GWC2_38_7]
MKKRVLKPTETFECFLFLDNEDELIALGLALAETDERVEDRVLGMVHFPAGTEMLECVTRKGTAVRIFALTDRKHFCVLRSGTQERPFRTLQIMYQEGFADWFDEPLPAPFNA